MQRNSKRILTTSKLTGLRFALWAGYAVAVVLAVICTLADAHSMFVNLVAAGLITGAIYLLGQLSRQ